MDEKIVQKTFEVSLNTIKEECCRQKVDDEFTRSQLDKFIKVTVKYIKEQAEAICKGIPTHLIESRIQRLKRTCNSMGVDVTTIIYSFPVQIIEEISLRGINDPSKLFEYADSILLAKQFQLFYLRNHLYASFQQAADTLGLGDQLTLDTTTSLQHQCEYLRTTLHQLRSRSQSIDIILDEMWNQVKKIMETYNIGLSIALFIRKNVSSKKECFSFLRELLRENSCYESFFHAFCIQINKYFTEWIKQQQLDPHLQFSFQDLFSNMNAPFIAYKNRIETLIPTICVALMQCVTTNVTRVQACLQKLEIDSLDRYFQERVSRYLSRKASEYSIPDEYHLNEIYHTVLKKNENYKIISMQKRNRATCIEQLLSPSFISLGRSPEEVKRGSWVY
ncbi:hypothetical protein WA171_004523 [Blastocystis sp. BT1]